jgi:hypothetical protein
MNWRVTYRDENAKHKSEIIQAENRHELFAKLSERKINAIKVEQVEKVEFSRKNKWPLVSGVIGVSIVGIVATIFCLSGDKKEEAPKSAPNKPRQVKEVTPAKPKPVVKKEVEKKPIDPNARPTKSCEVVNGYIKLPSGRIHKISGVVTNSIANRPKLKFEIFKRNCNNEIAAYLTLKPGDAIVDMPIYNGRFKKDFLASLEEPIIVNEDDSSEDAQLKRDVIAARLELKDAMDRGEDIEQIMLDTRKELQRLMVAKMQLKQIFYEERKKCETEKDVEDLFGACNKMLEEKGIAPLTYGPITKRNLMRSQNLESDQQ